MLLPNGSNIKIKAYGSSPVKRNRRTKSEIAAIQGAIYEFAEQENPVSVRQVFYNLTVRGIIEKVEKEYKSVVRITGLMRRAHELPFHWIADATRWQRKPTTWSGLDELLHNTAMLYRRSIWDSQDAYVEVWLEKEALAGVLFPVTAKWDVPLMVTRGYPSLSFLHSSAEMIESIGKPVHLYYLGDYDPSGIDIPRKVEQDIRTFAPSAEIYFNRIAVTSAQIKKWKLPSRPTKRTDSRAKNFKGESVELDAIPPSQLRELVQRQIESHVDDNALATLKLAEESEREYLQNMANMFGEGGAE